MAEDPNAIREKEGFKQPLKPPAEVAKEAAQAVGGVITDPRKRLVNLVSSFVLKEPKYAVGTDPATDEVVALVRQIGGADPEFVLKLALYVRTVLYMRSTTNFLLALAVTVEGCRPFVRDYLPPATNLPSDVLEVLEHYFKLTGETKLHACLRQAVVEKFAEFSDYQLGKYNTEGKAKRAKKAAKAAAAKGEAKEEEEAPAAPAAADPAAPAAAAGAKRAPPTKPTIKDVIRLCHIGQPATSIMGLQRRKYPATPEAFEKSGLPGEFDPARVGTKLRIPIPVTWETEISAKGNSAKVWEGLIEGKNLPFMAMMRNLRNLLQAGISEQFHQEIIGRLTDERQVAGSKQLPIRFLSAFEALAFTDEELAKLQQEAEEAKASGQTHREVEIKIGGGKKARKIKKKKPIPLHPPTKELLARYEEALDTAVKLSVVNNIPAIPGQSLILVDVSGSMDTKLSFGPNKRHALALKPHAKSTGKPLLEGEEYCLEDYFSGTGQRASHKVSMSMIWIGRDMDLSCAVLDDQANTITNVSYSSLEWEGCIKHSGDITDAPQGAEEVLSIDLDKVPERAHSIVFTVNSFSGEPFDALEEAAVALRDDGLEGGSAAGSAEICAFRLAGTGKHRALIVCNLFRKGRGWALRCLNTPQDGGQTVQSLAAKIQKELAAQKVEAERSVRRLVDVGILTALSLKYVSEECRVVLFAQPRRDQADAPGFVEVTAEDDSILQNIKHCHELRTKLDMGTVFPMGVLEQALGERQPLDYLVIISDNQIRPDGGRPFDQWLRKYRETVNPELVFASIDLLGVGTIGVDLDTDPKDVLVTGFSDQILKYIIDRKQDQVAHVASLERPSREARKQVAEQKKQKKSAKAVATE